jgi:hypothetical protein
MQIFSRVLSLMIVLSALSFSAMAQSPGDATYRHIRQDNQRPWDVTFHANKTLDVVYYGPNGIERDTGTWWDGTDGLRHWKYTQWQQGREASANLANFDATFKLTP